MMETTEGGAAPATAATPWPEVRQIGLADIIEVLAAGLVFLLAGNAIGPAPGAA